MHFLLTKGAGSGGGEGGSRPLCPLTGEVRGAEGAPQLRKHDIENIHISLNSRRILKENDKFFLSWSKSAPSVWCFNHANINNNKKNNRTWQNASFARFASTTLDASNTRFAPAALKSFQHPCWPVPFFQGFCNLSDLKWTGEWEKIMPSFAQESNRQEVNATMRWKWGETAPTSPLGIQ